MMDTKDQLAAIVRAFDELASAEYQDRIWVKGLGPEVSSYEEAICRLFDDLTIDELMGSVGFRSLFDKKQIETIRDFLADLDEFNDRCPAGVSAAEIVGDEAWNKIREGAKASAAILRLRLRN